ncbi:MAG: DUF2334 domain-containing protein [Pseudomonadota bacterium]
MKILVFVKGEFHNQLAEEPIDQIKHRLSVQFDKNPRLFNNCFKFLKVNVSKEEPIKICNSLANFEPDIIIYSLSLSFLFNNRSNPILAASNQFSVLIDPDGHFIFESIEAGNEDIIIRAKQKDAFETTQINKICKILINKANTPKLSSLMSYLQEFPRKGIIRIDDVPKNNFYHLDVATRLLDQNIPVLVNIIPKELNEENFKPWIKLKRKFSGLLLFGQHGLYHTDYSEINRSSFEFGPTRTYKQQLSDIIEGKNIIEKILGKDTVDIFCPPFNRYDLNSLRALNVLGFKIISVGSNIKDWDHNPIQVTSSLDPHPWVKGQPASGVFSFFVGNLILSIMSRNPCISIVLHPHLTQPAIMDKLIEMVILLKDKKAIEWKTIYDVI